MENTIENARTFIESKRLTAFDYVEEQMSAVLFEYGELLLKESNSKIQSLKSKLEYAGVQLTDAINLSNINTK